MDPIKVDFTGKSSNGPDKKTGVVIPPEKKGLKIAINIILTLVFGAVLYYFMLPVFNFKSILMYAFFGAICVFYCAVNFVTSGALRTPDYTPYARKSSLVPKIIIGVLLVVVAIGFIVSSVFFRASSYAEIISVQESNFEADITEADFANIPVIDETTTAVMADRALSDLAALDLVSQFTVQPSYYQINYQDTPVRVASLQYSNIIKWFTNSKNGLPGYIKVDAVTQKAEYVPVEGGMKYATAEHFNKNVVRHVRFKYPTYILDTPTFEIDESGRPYWIFAKLDMTIGLFGGKDVTGAIIVDAVTGECNEYSMEQISDNNGNLQWIDRVYSAQLLNEQYNYYGRYEGGFWNSILGQKNTYCTTEDYSYLALNDDVYMYTGVTSLTNDESITGFILINQRTKDAKYYEIPGAKETSAQSSAEGLVQQFGYKASFPLLINIDGEPTYFMSLKDSGDLVKGYAMINVGQYTIGATGTNLTECIDNYVSELAKNNINVTVDTDDILDNPAADKAEEKITATGKITEIRTAVIDGNSVYYIKLDSSDSFYSLKASDAENVVLVNKGDEITVTIKTDKGDIIPASALEVK